MVCRFAQRAQSDSASAPSGDLSGGFARGGRAAPSSFDGLLTGWHEPEASHLAMLEAIAGPDLLERSYTVALEEGYLWHEFGDVHLVLP